MPMKSTLTAIVVAILGVSASLAQAPAGPAGGSGRGGRGPQAPQVTSPEVSADRNATFRIYAPQAQNVRVSGGDIPNINTRGTMIKGANGVWEGTVGPLEPGAYRYNFSVDGITTV